jgi:hypothetical protein
MDIEVIDCVDFNGIGLEQDQLVGFMLAVINFLV